MTSDAHPEELDRPVEVHGGQGVQIGNHNQQVSQFIKTYVDNRQLAAEPVVRSAYLEQVKRIAPERLHDRDGEVAELTAFCTEPGRDPYAWWRAPAWAGKSALMSWFVLHPPPGVQVVSFFITARWKGQDDRDAFTNAVMEQLADLLGQPIPAYLTETTRELHLLRMLGQAAEVRHRRQQRLVLVVDGLDEDRSVTTGPDAHSIAALLPRYPPDGLRVILAGRPDPPIPADVTDDHPLRDPAIVRMLEGSSWAAVVRADMQRELKQLVHGSPAEQNLLGLVAAAGGGLSGEDLAELTGLSTYEIEEALHAVAGRTFTTRASHWTSETGAPVYVLGHEDLQAAATVKLGSRRLTEYRERLHAWADDYRQRDWPAETPEYLLRGYFRLLLEVADIPRLLTCATDQARHGPGNQAWAGAASALILVAARTAGDDGRPQPWALYDTGQAVAALVTQAQADGLAVHQMGGFDTDAVRAGFGLADTLTPVVVLAVGRQDGAAGLPAPLAAREAAPRTRHPVSDLLLPAPAARPLAA